METKLNIFKPFFEYPKKQYYIRDLSRLIKINHTTVRLYLIKLEKETYLIKNKKGIYPTFKLNINKKTLNLKLFYNLEKIRKSYLIENLEKNFDFPVIILFGSYSKAKDYENSDLDLCLITKIRKNIDLKKYEKIINRETSLHFYENLKNAKNKELINNICNGIVLSGELEVV